MENDRANESRIVFDVAFGQQAHYDYIGFDGSHTEQETLM